MVAMTGVSLTTDFSGAQAFHRTDLQSRQKVLLGRRDRVYLDGYVLGNRGAGCYRFDWVFYSRCIRPPGAWELISRLRICGNSRRARRKWRSLEMAVDLVGHLFLLTPWEKCDLKFCDKFLPRFPLVPIIAIPGRYLSIAFKKFQ